jgi:uncharacterized Fe-S center protein
MKKQLKTKAAKYFEKINSKNSNSSNNKKSNTLLTNKRVNTMSTKTKSNRTVTKSINKSEKTNNKLVSSKMIAEISKNTGVSEKNTKILSTRKYPTIRSFLLDLGKALKVSTKDGIPNKRLFVATIKKYRKAGKLFVA